jgi:hypothetical protein
MDKITNVLKTGWEYFLDGVDYTASWIEAYPKVTLALIVAYVAIRR